MSKQKKYNFRNIKELKQAVQEGKQIYTVYSNEDNNEHIKVSSIKNIEDDINNESFLNVVLETGVECDLCCWEMTPYNKKEVDEILNKVNYGKTNL